MKDLYQKQSKNELQLCNQTDQPYCVITFYKLCNLTATTNIQKQLFNECRKNNIKGTILIAAEGINSTVVGTYDGITKLWQKITAIPEFSNIIYKISYADSPPFDKLKVKIKESVITFNLPQKFEDAWHKNETNQKPVRGEYLDPEAWDDLIANPDTILVDTRNHYEVAMGSFQNAINPLISNFSELSRWVEENLANVDKTKPIAMYCTGGIRCEKSTSLLKIMGFTNVYHLRDGILSYLEHRKRTKTNSTWQGQLFVFDNRVGLNKDLEPI